MPNRKDRLTVRCPGCRAEFLADRALAGRKVRCGDCRRVFVAGEVRPADYVPLGIPPDEPSGDPRSATAGGTAPGLPKGGGAKPGSKPRRKKGGRDPLPVWLVLVIMLAPFLAVWLYFAPVDSGPSSESRGGSSYSGGSSNEQKLRAVLGNIPLTVEEAEWVEFDDNIVYVGFRTRPADLDALLRAWAVQGNAAINFGCHVWAVPASNPRSDPLRGGHYAEVTARYGRVE